MKLILRRESIFSRVIKCGRYLGYFNPSPWGIFFFLHNIVDGFNTRVLFVIIIIRNRNTTEDIIIML